MMNRKLSFAIFCGLIATFLEAVLLIAVEPNINNWALLQAILFWFSCGFTCYWLHTNLNRILQSILVTLFLCLPWYIAESVGKSTPEHFLPLVIASLVMGLIIGITTKLLDKRMVKSTEFTHL